MPGKLQDLSLEELWELFPIVLVKPKENWALAYREIEIELQTLLRAEPVVRISHIGSTAIPGIWTKNIVDVLIEIAAEEVVERIARILERNGFLRMSATESRVSLNRGYTPDGFAERVFHVHVRCAGDNDELYFRDYMIDHPNIAKDYEKLKLQLWTQFEHNRDGYTDAKSAFVRKWTEAAKREFQDRYAPPVTGQ